MSMNQEHVDTISNPWVHKLSTHVKCLTVISFVVMNRWFVRTLRVRTNFALFFLTSQAIIS